MCRMSFLFNAKLYLQLLYLNSVSLITVVHSEAGVLYDKEKFQGTSVPVDLEGCQNLHSFNKKVSSVQTKEGTNASCIRLYQEFGCHGWSLDLDIWDTNCGEDLARCHFNNLASSVSSCDYDLLATVSSDQPVKTTRGKECKTVCAMTDGTYYFWCYTDDRKKRWDYCSPLQDITCYGDNCNTPCSNRGYSYSWCWCSKCKYNSRKRIWNDSWGYCSLNSR